MKKLLFALLLQSFAMASSGFAATPMRLLPSTTRTHAIPQQKLLTQVQSKIDITRYRQVNVQVVDGATGTPDHLLVYLFSKGLHRVRYARMALDSNLNVGAVTYSYRPAATDHAAQPLATTATCPDPTIDFIAFAPNDDTLEQQVTEQVAQAAEAAKLKTVRLLKEKATSQAYLNYMSCPNLKGNFYDGDADPSTIVTYDGELSDTDFSKTLAGKFRYHVVNIWLACEAYNDPMLSAVQNGAMAQKYAAGVNDLEIGPSDNAGACAMEAAIAGKAMTQAFNDCYKQFDNTSDQWGFGGKGLDYFGQ